MPPYTTSACGCSATSASRLFWIIRYAASVSQLLQVFSAPRGARIVRVGSRRGSMCFGLFMVALGIRKVFGRIRENESGNAAKSEMSGEAIAAAGMPEIGDRSDLALRPRAPMQHEARFEFIHGQQLACIRIRSQRFDAVLDALQRRDAH